MRKSYNEADGVGYRVCPFCADGNQKSAVMHGLSSSTLMYCTPYYDEDGNYHHHDTNTTKTYCRCSNGHGWEFIHGRRCDSCDWGYESQYIKNQVLAK